jgi:hypothetical protein
LNYIEAVKSRYLKKLLCVSKYSKSRLVYELIGEKYFVEELKVKFKLETTNAYQKLIEIRNNKNDDIPLSFYSTPAFKTNSPINNAHFWATFDGFALISKSCSCAHCQNLSESCLKVGVL